MKYNIKYFGHNNLRFTVNCDINFDMAAHYKHLYNWTREFQFI